MTQHEKIYSFLSKNEYITPMDAFRYLGITKLSTRIGEMRRKGIRIESEMVHDKNSSYMRYWLQKDNVSIGNLEIMP